MTKLTVAALQLALGRKDENANIAAVAAMVEQAAADGARLVLPPETLLGAIFLPRGRRGAVRARPAHCAAPQCHRHARARGAAEDHDTDQLF